MSENGGKTSNQIILPFNGRSNGLRGFAEESIFSSGEGKNIPLLGEIIRKLTHLGALAIPVAYYLLEQRLILAVLGGSLVLSLIIDYVRVFGKYKSKRFIHKYFGIIIRPREKRGFTGATYIILGSILTILFFDKPVALAAIAYIVVGDTAGAIIGRRWGLVRFGGKSLEGSISFFLACSIIAVIVPGIPFWVKIAGALIATVVEALVSNVDDNLIVPITSGALMQLIVSQTAILRYLA